MMWRQRLTMVILPLPPPIPENKRILFIGLWGGLRCIYGKQRSYLKI
jgi:hypothetical protein